MKTKRFTKFSVSLVAVVAVLALVLSGCGADTAKEYNKYLKDDKPAVTVDKDKDNSADKADKDSEKETDKKDDKASSTDKSNDKSNKESSKSDSKSDNKSNSSSSSSSSKPSTGNSGSSSSSKPSTGSGSSSGSSSKPSTGNSGNSGSSSGNSGNSGSNKPHQHNYSTVVSSTNGDCSHKGKVTKKCSCGATITVDGNYGSHNWKDSYKEVYHEAVTKPVYAYCYVCNECGAQFKDEQTCGEHCIFDCGGGYSYKEWVDHEEVVTPAWTERVYNGKDCTICGHHSS